MSVHCSGLSSPDQPLQLCTAVVLSLARQFLDVDIWSEQVEASHLVGVDGQDLDTALLIRQTWRLDDEERKGWKAKMDMGMERQEGSVERLDGETKDVKE